MKKTFRAMACLVALVLAFAALGVTAKADAYGYGVVYNSNSVNLRSEPSQYAEWLGAYPAGTWMSINGESGNWYYVTAPDGKGGYMSKNYVRVPQNSYGNIVVVDNPKATDFLNLREYPSYSAKVVDIYYNDVPCLVLSSSNGWYQVNVDGQIGYFRSEYVYQVNNVAYSTDVATVVTANGGGLNLRSAPNKNASILASLKNRSYVMVLEKGETWWKVSDNGQVGYVMASFLKDGIVQPTQQTGASGGSQNGGQSGSNAGSSTGSNTLGSFAIVTNPVSTQVLNLRETASTSARVLGQYRNGTRLRMLEQGTEWCKVEVVNTGKVGYMMTRYLTLNNLPAVPTLTVTHPQRSFVNLRSGPSMNTGRILLRMNHGSVVTVLEPGATWTKVNYNGNVGYAMNAFLK